VPFRLENPSPDCSGNPFLLRHENKKDCSEKQEMAPKKLLIKNLKLENFATLELCRFLK
jgi:hypothetical protein